MYRFILFKIWLNIYNMKCQCNAKNKPFYIFFSVRCESPDSAVDLHSLPSSSSSSSPSNQDLVVEGEVEERTTTATQTGLEENSTDFDRSKLTVDRHCYECHVKYRDPQHKDLVMFLHASKYQVTGTAANKN